MLEKSIIDLLKKHPMTRKEISNSFPVTMEKINSSLTSLLLNGKLSIDGNKYFLAKKQSKYRNQKTEVDGIKFDSKLEAERYQQLKLMELAGQIKNIQRQVPFVVVDPVVWNDKKLREIKYVCDFMYEENGKKIVEDSKGVVTEKYRIKRQLFLSRYPSYEFREVNK